jgi:hypothetical protein
MTYSDRFKKAWLGGKANALIPVKLGLSGRYTLIKGSERGEQVVAEFDNLITNGGLDRLGMSSGSGILNYCQVGTGSTTPAFTDTSLAGRFASHSSIDDTTSTGSDITNLYRTTTHRYRFNAGVFNNTVISEVGIGWASSGGLFSRALILDSGGSPTAITLLDDEYLDVVYSLRLNYPTIDVTGTTTISGESYDYILRSYQYTGIVSLSDLYFNGLDLLVGYTGELGTVVTAPSGTSESIDVSVTTGVYTAGNYYVDITSGQVGLNDCNLSGGIKSITFARSSGGTGLAAFRFQIQFTPAIPKTASKVMTLSFRISWGRA